MLETIFLYLLISLLFNIVLFFIAFKLQSDKLTDISYALTFMLIATIGFTSNDITVYSSIVLLMVFAWALRIGSFLLYRVIKVGKDARFDDMRSSFVKFGQFWVLQGLSVWVLMIPFVLAVGSASSALGIFAYIGIGIFLLGLCIETVADLQKMRFNNKPENKGKWIESGIWKYSRHPNYFGEILVWVGVYLYAVQVLSVPAVLIALVSPLFITVLLLFVSGIPLLEKSADKRWGKVKAYRQYRERTSILVPLQNRIMREK